MSKLKKILALTLAMALSVGMLAGCAEKNDDEKDGASSSTSAQQEKHEVKPMDLTGVTDPFKATSGIAGDTVVAKAGDEEITAAEVLNWANYGIELYLQQMGPYGITTLPWDEEKDGVTLAESVMESALDSAVFYHMLPKMAAEEKITLTDEEKNFVAEDLKKAEEQAGSKEKLDHVLWVQMVTPELYQQNFEAGTYFMHMAEKFYGPDAKDYPTEEQVRAYAQDELGMYRVKHILVSTRDMETGEEMDKDAVAEKKAQAEQMLNEIKNAADPAAKFDELMKAKSEDPGLATNPDGYEASRGRMMPEFEEASLKLKDGEIVSEPIKTDAGYHLIMRLPLQDIDAYRNSLISDLMEKRCDKWLEDYPVKKTRKFNKIDVEDFRNQVESLQAAVREEIQASMPAPDDTTPVPPDASAPDASAPDASTPETKSEG